MLTVSQIIDRLGGTSIVAAGLGLTPSVVSSWKANGHIPNWRRAAILVLPPRDEGEPIAERDFPQRKPIASAA